jgi:phage protein U
MPDLGAKAGRNKLRVRTMLAQLGSVTFEIWPVNIHEHSHEGEAAFAEKAVMGRRPPLEFVGEGPDSRTLKGKLFPKKLGGSLDALHTMRLAGVSQPLMFGDGTPQGWYVIEKVSETSTYLAADGTGQVIEFEVSLKKDDPADGGDLFSILFGLLG